MAKFCKKCGSRLDETTGLCTNCDTKKIGKHSNHNQLEANSKQVQSDNNISTERLNHERVERNGKKDKKSKKRAKRGEKKLQKKAKKTRGSKIRRFILGIILILVILSVSYTGAIIVLMHFEIVESPVIEQFLEKINLNSEDSEDYEVEYLDADEYFQENSDISSTIDAVGSENVPTEKEVMKILKKKGFKTYPISTEYDMDGTYYEEKEISKSSSDKHPMYITYYYTKKEELWTILVIDGDIMANPVSYNMQADSDKQIIVSESETITSYDNITNQFYRTVPNKSVLNVKVVKKINAKTLEKLTIEEMSK